MEFTIEKLKNIVQTEFENMFSYRNRTESIFHSKPEKCNIEDLYYYIKYYSYNVIPLTHFSHMDLGVVYPKLPDSTSIYRLNLIPIEYKEIGKSLTFHISTVPCSNIDFMFLPCLCVSSRNVSFDSKRFELEIDTHKPLTCKHFKYRKMKENFDRNDKDLYEEVLNLKIPCSDQME